MRIILLGAPGAGKGTQAKKISKKLNVAHISTGDILRSESKSGTELGNKAKKYMQDGKLVPDDLIIDMMKERLTGKNAGKGFVLDGFPRTVAQAEMLDDMLNSYSLGIDRVINIIVDDDTIIRRLTSRRVCRSCGAISRAGSLKRGGKAICQACGGELYKRDDDDIEVITRRLEVYKKQTRPLIDYYRNKKILSDIDGMGSEEEVTERIISVL